jgi:hypothetical protein
MCTLIFTIRKLNSRKSAAKLGSVIRKALHVAEQQLKGTFVAEQQLKGTFAAEQQLKGTFVAEL